MSSNPKFFVAVVLLCLSGCGFTPLYGGGAGRNAVAELDTVHVENIPDRTGQMLRQSLQQQLYTAGAPTTELYALSVTYTINQNYVGIQSDSSSTRDRFNAAAVWKLTPIGYPGRTLISGNATAVDAMNIIDQQYFASNLESDTIKQQLAEQIARQITIQLAAWFRVHHNS